MKTFSLALVFLLSIKSFCQNKQWQEISVADGLSHGTVFSMKQDYEGYVWMASKAGLNRYDGTNFKTFTTHTSITFAINSNQPTALLEDSKKRLWIGTQQGGLNLYDAQTGRFYHCLLKTSTKNVSQHIYCMIEDPQGDLWVGTLMGSIFKVILPAFLKRGKFPEQEDFTEAIKVIPLETFLPSTIRINAFKVLKNKQLAVLSQAGYGHIDYIKNQYIPIVIEHEGAKRFLSIYEAADGTVVLTQPNLVIKIQNNKSEILYESNEQQAQQMKIDKLGNVWLLDKKRLYKVHYTQLTPNYSFGEPVCQSNNLFLILALEVDRDNNTWVSTGGYGVLKEKGKAYTFEHYFKSNSIWSLFEDSRNRLILNHFKAFFVENRLDMGLKTLKAHLKDTHALLEDEKGNFWQLRNDTITYSKMTLTHLDKDFHAIEHYDIDKPSIGENLGKMCMDKQGNLLITGIGATVIRFNLRLKKFEYFLYNHLLEDNIGITSNYLDIANNLWISSKNGLFRATPTQSGGYNFRGFRHAPLQPHSIADNSVSMVLDDYHTPADYLWIATLGGGLSRMNKHDETFLHFNTKNGLPNDYILGLLADSDGNLWLSTNRGLAKFNTKTFASTNFTAEDGLQSDEFSIGACFKNKAGELMFGGVNGLNIFDPKDFSKTKREIMLKIHELKINNQEVLPFDKTAVLKSSIEFTKEVSLAYDQTHIRFGFSLIDFKDAKKNRFRYQFLGIDEDWIEAGNERFANYSELPTGSYVFRLSGSVDGSEWSKPIEIKIKVNPPFYATWWAYLFYLSIISYIAYRFYQFQINKVRLNQELAFNQIEKKRLAELDQLKTNFFTNISHEFRTPLTLILSPIEDLIRENPSKNIYQVIQRNANRLLQLINQLLDLSKLEAGKLQVELEEVALSHFFRRLTSSFSSLAESKDIAFEVNISTQNLVGMIDTDKIEKIVNNLLSNAFKFTEKGKKVSLFFDYLVENQAISIQIKDEGIGISKEKLPQVFQRFYQIDEGSSPEKLNRKFEGSGIGLALVKELVEVLKGKIYVESEVGIGTSFLVEIPLLLKENIVFEEKNTISNSTDKNNLQSQNKEMGEISKKIHPNSENILLIVDDNEDIRNYIKSVFENDYQIVEAKNGIEGLKKANETIPNLIISDLMMPEMDGFEFCKNIKSDQKTSHIPIILLTAKANIESKIEGLELGADDYLLKPFNTNEVLVRVKNLVEKQAKLRDYYLGKTIELKPNEIKVNAKDEVFLKEAKEILENYLAKSDFGVESFATQMNMSQTQILRKLKALTGLTVNEFIRDFRLQRAADLLSKKSANVSEIAFQVGFESLSYFAKTFKEKYGKLPSEFNS